MKTSSGVTYTPEWGATSDGGECVWYMRDDRKNSTRPVPTCLFFHGATGSSTSFLDSSIWKPLRDILIDQGWAIIEGDGGGGHNWGGPHGQAMYLEMFEWFQSNKAPGILVLLGQSMGALPAYNLAAHGPLADRHSALIIQNGTTDLIARYSDHTRPVYHPMNLAYGVPGVAHQPELFAASASPHDPMQFSRDVWTGKRVRQVIGAQDTAVPPETHGMAWLEKYGHATLKTDVFINDPGGHDPLLPDMLDTAAYMQSLVPLHPEMPTFSRRVYEVISIEAII